jgi:hypothetical protein
MKLFVLLLLLSTACTSPSKQTSTTATNSKISLKTKITELFACFKYKKTQIDEEDLSNGYMRIGTYINGEVTEGYETLHLFKHNDTNIIGWLSYDCGPACSQYSVKWFKVSSSCKIETLTTKDLFGKDIDSKKVTLSLPKKGYDAYLLQLPGSFDIDATEVILLIEKYTWKDGKFVLSKTYEDEYVPMTEENISKYFHW